VGCVRVLTDGYFFATIPEILVLPVYRRRGIGWELMWRAVESRTEPKVVLRRTTGEALRSASVLDVGGRSQASRPAICSG
jgi:GNAT superfamily N-acetyltransferase